MLTAPERVVSVLVTSLREKAAYVSCVILEPWSSAISGATFEAVMRLQLVQTLGMGAVLW